MLRRNFVQLAASLPAVGILPAKPVEPKEFLDFQCFPIPLERTTFYYNSWHKNWHAGFIPLLDRTSYIEYYIGIGPCENIDKLEYKLLWDTVQDYENLIKNKKQLYIYRFLCSWSKDVALCIETRPLEIHPSFKPFVVSSKTKYSGLSRIYNPNI